MGEQTCLQACCQKPGEREDELVSGVEVRPPNFQLRAESAESAKPPQTPAAASGPRRRRRRVAPRRRDESPPAARSDESPPAAQGSAPYSSDRHWPGSFGSSLSVDQGQFGSSLSVDLGQDLNGQGSGQSRRSQDEAALTAFSTGSHSLVVSELTETRAIRARLALWGCGRVFRYSDNSLYSRSRPVGSVDFFWSHCWTGPVWAKVSTLLVYHNALPSFILAGVAALIPGLLLPLERVELAFMLGTVFAATVMLATIVLWPNQDSVFLDKCCIHQDNADLKRAGILSIGTTLARTRNLVVIWDKEYFTRMWCVFELAVWLKLREGNMKSDAIHVLPCHYGNTVAIILAAATGFIILGNVLAIAAISPHQSLAPLSSPALQELLANDVRRGALCLLCLSLVARVTLRELQYFTLKDKQLKDFSIRQAKCTCCSFDHKDKDTGLPISCDRELIESVIIGLFGSMEAFDTDVQDKIFHKIKASALLPYRYMVLMSTPFLFEAIGGSAWMAQNGPPGQIFTSFNLYAEAKGGREARSKSCTIMAPALASACTTMKFFLDSFCYAFLGLWWGFLVRIPICAGIVCLAFREELGLRRGLGPGRPVAAGPAAAGQKPPGEQNLALRRLGKVDT